MKTITAVLLPGLDGTGELFAPLVAAAPQGIRTVVVDYPMSKASMDVLDRCARERLKDNCIVIAESFSGPISVRIAADERVQALVLCNSFVSSPISPALRYFAISPFFVIPVPEFILRFFLLGRESSPALIKSVRSTLRRMPANVAAHRVREVLNADERTSFRSLRKPVLYLQGLGDQLVSERGLKELLEIRPDIQVSKIRGPHMLLQAAPAECWTAIQRFVEDSAVG